MNEVATKKAPAYTQIRVREPAGQRTFEEALTIGGEDAQVVVPGVEAGAPLRIERHGGVWVASGAAAEARHNGRSLSSPYELRIGDVLAIGEADVVVHDISRTLLQLEVAHRVGNVTITPMAAVSSLPDDVEEEEIVIRAAPATRADLGLPSGAPATIRTALRRLAPRWWVWAAGALVLAALLTLVASFEPIALDLSPGSARVRTPETLLAFRSGDRLLVLPGEHRLRAEAPGYVPAETTVNVEEGTAAVARLSLVKGPGRLEIDTGGVPATVSVDGVAAGRAPGVLEIAAGSRTVTLRAPRYLDYVAAVEIQGAGEPQQLRAKLLPNWGTVRITSDPAKVRVSVDGREAGSTPLALQLPAGVRRVQLAAEGLKTWESSLVVKAGETRTIGPIKLGQPEARLAVRSVPTGAEVTVGGALRGRTPLEIDLSPGMSHEVLVSLPGHASWSRALFADPSAKLAVEARLDPILARVAFRGQPEAADVLINGVARGTTPTVLDLVTAEHRVEIRKEGYQPFTTTVLPTQGLESAVEYRLLSADRATALAETAPVIKTRIGYELRFVPPGTFSMGSERREQGRRPNEGLRQVTLKRPFYIGTTEVTNGQFRRFRTNHASGYIEKRTVDLDAHPASKVSWDDAAAYANWLSSQEGLTPAYVERDGRLTLRVPATEGYRLPTEAEWEYAGRFAAAGKHRRYEWGDSLPVPQQIGNLAGAETGDELAARLDAYQDEFPVVAPVAQFPANPLGLHDFTGNVSEWVNDFYLSFVDAAAVVDPLGPASGNLHAIRGSNWRTALASELRLAWRDSGQEGSQAIGFRLARYAD
jgi:formylglycine-generating enzyme required for sulfatase activity